MLKSYVARDAVGTTDLPEGDECLVFIDGVKLEKETFHACIGNQLIVQRLFYENETTVYKPMAPYKLYTPVLGHRSAFLRASVRSFSFDSSSRLFYETLIFEVS